MPFRDKGAVIIDLTGRIAFASVYFCDLVGIEHDKIKGVCLVLISSIQRT
jgi:hypothetical protein